MQSSKPLYAPRPATLSLPSGRASCYWPVNANVRYIYDYISQSPTYYSLSMSLTVLISHHQYYDTFSRWYQDCKGHHYRHTATRRFRFAHKLSKIWSETSHYGWVPRPHIKVNICICMMWSMRWTMRILVNTHPHKYFRLCPDDKG